MRKKLISFLSAITLVCSTTYGATVESIGNGYKGDIKIRMSYEGNQIKDIEVLEQQESNFTKRAMNQVINSIIETQNTDVDNIAGATYTSEGVKEAVKAAVAAASNFTKRAMNQVINSIIETQNTDVDNIAGATYTSEGVKEAVKAAVAAAGITLSSKAPVQKQTATITDTTTDIVVVGGGGAGLTAAIAAKEKGANVILLEKMPMLGGNTNYATAGINAANSKLQKDLKIEDTSKLFYDDTLKGGKNKNNPELLKTLTDNSGDIITWLTERGADITEISYTGGQSIKRTHRPTGGKAIGPVVVEALSETAQKQGIDIRTDSYVSEILKEGNSVVGVKVKHNDQTYTIKSKAVIMATGGFGANPEMVKQYNPNLQGFGSTNSPAITGEGIKMVQKAGGDLVDMTEIQTHNPEMVKQYNPNLQGFGSTNSPAITGEGIKMVQKAGGDLVDMTEIQTHPTVVHNNTAMITEAVRGEGAVLINRDGKRFINELETRDVVSKAELSQPGKSAFLVFDQGIREKLKAADGYVKKGFAKEAATIEELAKKLGIDPKNMVTSIDQYNQYVKNGKDTDFNKDILPKELNQGPFYAIEVSPAVHHTMGGVRIFSTWKECFFSI